MTNSIAKIRKTNPIVLNVSNSVTQQHVADAINFIGASPIMFDDEREASELINISSALVINLGTINRSSIQKSILSGQAANQKHIPVIVDPVAIAASTIRTEHFDQLIKKVKINVLRGNIAEVAAIAGVNWQNKGIDAGDGQGDRLAIAKKAANQLKALVVVSGQEDIVTDGTNSYLISNGNQQLATNVGSGDMLDGIIAAALGTEQSLESCVLGTAILAIAGEIAAERFPHQPYSFFNQVFDVLGLMDDSQYMKYLKIKKIPAQDL